MKLVVTSSAGPASSPVMDGMVAGDYDSAEENGAIPMITGVLLLVAQSISSALTATQCLLAERLALRHAIRPP
ncbi:hypothetical protein I8F96_11255 [Enterococcus casseliflavus]|nr:hypothetical protein [Enterococcus casseliflavus]